MSKQVHTLYTETKPNLVGLKKDAPEVHDLIYFLDEDLGHWLTFIPYYLLLALLCRCYRVQSHQLTSTRRWLCLGAGGLMGLTHAVAVIEGSHPWLGVLAAPVLLIGCWQSLDSSALDPVGSAVLVISLPFGAFQGRRVKGISPFLVFNFGLTVGIMVGLTLYRIAVGSFQEPSELGGVIAVAKRVILCFFTRAAFTAHC